MLQRIQTVYMLIIAVLMTCTAFFPLATFVSEDIHIELGLFGLRRDGNLFEPMWGLFILTAVIIVLDLIAVMQYKKRTLQIRICIYNAILLIFYYGLFAYMAYISKQALPDMELGIKLALSFPVISLILDYLAIRNIGADEVLVRSLDRLR